MDLKDAYHSKNKRKIALIVIMLIISTIIAIYSICISKYHIGFSEAWQIVINAINNIEPIEYTDRLKKYIVWDGLIPRSIAGALVGGVLALGGAVMQTIIKNPLTDSYTTGISSGALFGVTVYIILGFGIIPGLSDNIGMILNAFIFALIPSAIIILFSVFKKVTPTTMVLIGIAVMYIFSATTTLLKYTCTEEDLATIYAWSIGTLGKIDWDSIPFLLLAFGALFILMMLLSKKLNVLSSDDCTAKSLGVDPSKVRIICLILISITTATAVCFTGTIGFVGLIAPHMARMLVGSNTHYLIPASVVTGALMLIVADCLSRIVGSIGLPVGVVTALVGGPLFLFFLIKQKKSEW